MFFPCRPASPLNFQSVSPDPFIAAAAAAAAEYGGDGDARRRPSPKSSDGGLTAGVVGDGLDGSFSPYPFLPSSSPSSSSAAASACFAKTKSPPLSSTVRMQRSASPGGRWGGGIGSGGGGGGDGDYGDGVSGGAALPSPSQWVAAAATGATAAGTPARFQPLAAAAAAVTGLHPAVVRATSGDRSSTHSGDDMNDGDTAGDHDEGDGEDSQVRRTGSIEEVGWGSSRVAAAAATVPWKSPRRSGAPGISGGTGEPSVAKRARSVRC